jgi:uncharacterized membrane protein YeaQ/YmgE (transglycosylase-associated protein family)
MAQLSTFPWLVTQLQLYAPVSASIKSPTFSLPQGGMIQRVSLSAFKKVSISSSDPYSPGYGCLVWLTKTVVISQCPRHTGNSLEKLNPEENNMFHLIWYILVGLIAGVLAKSVMHVHIAIFWTIVLGIIGSIIGGAVTHMFARPANERYHPAGLIFSTLGAILVLFVCYKLKIHFPSVR